jgi:hypothetical protein
MPSSSPRSGILSNVTPLKQVFPVRIRVVLLFIAVYAIAIDTRYAIAIDTRYGSLVSI